MGCARGQQRVVGQHVGDIPGERQLLPAQRQGTGRRRDEFRLALARARSPTRAGGRLDRRCVVGGGIGRLDGRLGLGTSLPGPQPLAPGALARRLGGLLEGVIAIALGSQVNDGPARALGRPRRGTVVGFGRRRGPPEDPVTHLTQPLRDHPHRGRGDDKQPEKAEHEQQNERPDGRDGGGQRAGGEEAEDASGCAHSVGTGRRRRYAVRQVGDPAGGEGQGEGSDDDPVGRRVVIGSAKQAQAEHEQHQRQGVGDPSERPGGDSMDDVADDPLEAPPLTRRNDDRDRDEQEADTVTTVLRLEFGGGVANLADGAAGDVRHPEPGSAHGPQRERHTAALGPPRGPGGAPGCAGARPGVCGARGRAPGGGLWACGRSRRSCRHDPEVTPPATPTPCATRVTAAKFRLRTRTRLHRPHHVPLSSTQGHECQRTAPAC